MNKLKLSNNLSIDNIINSYKRRGYYGQQLDAIRQGLERGFDVSIYDDKRFDHQMWLHNFEPLDSVIRDAVFVLGPYYVN